MVASHLSFVLHPPSLSQAFPNEFLTSLACMDKLCLMKKIPSVICWHKADYFIFDACAFIPKYIHVHQGYAAKYKNTNDLKHIFYLYFRSGQKLPQLGRGSPEAGAGGGWLRKAPSKVGRVEEKILGEHQHRANQGEPVRTPGKLRRNQTNPLKMRTILPRHLAT